MLRRVSVGEWGLLLAGILLSLVLGEILVRVCRLAPEVNQLEITKPYGQFVISDNPILKYVPKANSRGINSLGFRDREYSLSKPDGVFRILVLGDSVTFGFCTDTQSLALDDIFPKVLERRFDARASNQAPRVEVINLAVSGYDTVQEAEFLRTKGLELQPDLVVVAYCLNDAWTASAELIDFHNQSEQAPAAASTPTWLVRAFHDSALVRFAWQRLVLLAQRGSGPDAGSPPPGYQTPTTGFGQIREMGRRHGFETIVAIVPLFEEYDTYRWLADHQAITRLAEQHGFVALDLLAAFRDGSGNDFRKLQGRCNREHPDEAGHRLIAEALGKLIGTRFLGRESPKP
jgi:lysophospholipase L1-like esterase